MKKGLITTSAVLAIFIGYFIASPYIAVNGLKSAVQSGDKEELEERIDFPVLKQDLKDQLNAAMMRKARAESQDDPFAAIAVTLGAAMVNGLVDNFVTPAALSNLMQGNTKGIPEQNTQQEPLSNAILSFSSLDKFEINLKGEDQKEIKMYLYRHGLSWKLSKIQLPLDDA